MKPIQSTIIFVVLLLCISACKKSSSTPAPTAAFSIGQHYGGGIVFYIDNTSMHGLIASSVDIGPTAQWDDTPGTFKSANAFSQSDGLGNTTKIVATLRSTGSAAAICVAYTGGGYTDWFLPSLNQLATLYSQKGVFPNLQNYKYWSSTEESSYIGNAYSLDMGNGQYTNELKTTPYYVRAIRVF